jgi:hypothetical protein
VKRFQILLAAGGAALLCSQAALAVEATNHLVYNFTYSANQAITARDSPTAVEAVGNQMPGAAGQHGAGDPGTALIGGNENGMSHYGGSLTDKGTMTVDILSKQPDGGLVVSISEQGQGVRRAPPATCVVYGNTTVDCDPNKTVYTEEYTLLRFLGSNFVNPSELDAKRHWAITQSGANANVKADYTVNSDSGGLMQISENRQIQQIGAGNLTTNVEAKIGYDSSRALPTSIDEYTTQRTDSGVNGTSTTTYQTTLQLVSTTPAAP